MPLKLPWVPRSTLEQVEAALAVERARVDRLTTEILTMRRDGFIAPTKAGRVREAPPAPEEIGLKRAESHFIETAKKDLKAKVSGLSDADAEREAKRLRDLADMEQPPQ